MLKVDPEDMRPAIEEEEREGEDEDDDDEEEDDDDDEGTGGGGATGGRKEKSSLEEREGSEIWDVSEEVIDGCVGRFFRVEVDRMISGLFLKLDFLILCSVRKSVTSTLALLYF